MGQIESDGIFVSGVKAQEPMITGSLSFSNGIIKIMILLKCVLLFLAYK